MSLQTLPSAHATYRDTEGRAERGKLREELRGEGRGEEI
jgi:hypothetical protein